MNLPAIRRRIEFADTDASGRAHFAALLRHVEAAEHEILRHLGIPVLDAKLGGWPRAHIECDYSAPLAPGDEIEVRLHPESVGESSLTWSFEILSPSGHPAAQGRIVTVHTTPTGHPAPIPPEWRQELLAE